MQCKTNKLHVFLFRLFLEYTWKIATTYVFNYSNVQRTPEVPTEAYHTHKKGWILFICMIRQSLLALFMNMFRVGFILDRFGFVKYQRWLKRIFESVPYTQKFTTIQNRSYTFLTCNIMMRLFVHKNVTQTKNDNQQTTKGKCESLKIFLRYNFICKRSCNFNLFVQKYKIYAK